MSVSLMSIEMKRETLQEIVTYDPAAGIFLSAVDVPGLYYRGQMRVPVMRKPNSKAAPQPALKIKGYFRRASHIAFILVTGEPVPPGMGLFFKDGDKTNLEWANLVLAKQSCGGKI